MNSVWCLILAVLCVSLPFQKIVAQTILSETSNEELKVEIPSATEESEQISEAESKPSAQGARSNRAAASAESEAEIPVKIPKSAIPASSDFQTRLWLGLGFILISLVGSFIFLRRFRQKNSLTSQLQMKVLSQHHLGPRKSLAVVRVAGESLLLGITDHHISHIKTLSLLDEDVPDADLSDTRMFGSVLRRTQNTGADPIEQAGESFSLSSIRDVVKRKSRKINH